MKNAGALILTLAFVGGGIYVGSKNYKRDGFWSGTLAMGLLTGVGFTLVAKVTGVKTTA